MTKRTKAKYLKTTDVAALCGISSQTMSVWLGQGHGPPFFRPTPGAHVRFKKQDVANWLRAKGFDVPQSLLDDALADRDALLVQRVARASELWESAVGSQKEGVE